MCGIAGIIDFEGRPISRAALERACCDLAHRGPDDRGVWIHESPGFSVGLAHTRLAVIDPRPEGHQPMLDAAGRRAVVYNGELYNYRALRAELPDRTRTESDTEVILQACAAWGPAALHRFDAMWALAFVDIESRTGHLSRDPFGIKPLFYACQGGRLLFASELATLRRLENLPAELDPAAIDLYLQLGFIPQPQTIYRQIHKLPPGHLLVFDARGPRDPQRYYHLPPPADAPPTYAEAVEEVRRRTQLAARGQRVADVPLGAFLSGGLDSTVVTACLAEAGGPAVKTFSIGYADHPAYDETGYAQLAAERFGTDHHAFQLTFAEVLAAVEPTLNRLGEPFADSSLLPATVVSGHTRRIVTVALSGDGGDELFGGYWRYLGQHYLDRYERLPALLRRRAIEPLLRLAPSAKSTRWLNRLRQVRKLLRGSGLDPLDRHLAWARYIDQALTAEILGAERARVAAARLRRLYEQAARGWREGTPPRDGLEGILLADLAIGLPADMLLKVDTASMAHNLEVRVPLLSRDLVEYVAALPTEYKLAGAHGKRILRDAFRGIVPDEILGRRKMGFEVPVGEFLRKELRGLFHDTVTPGALDSLGIAPAAMTRLYDAHDRRREDYADILWALLVLCWWRAKNP